MLDWCGMRIHPKKNKSADMIRVNTATAYKVSKSITSNNRVDYKSRG